MRLAVGKPALWDRLLPTDRVAFDWQLRYDSGAFQMRTARPASAPLSELLLSVCLVTANCRAASLPPKPLPPPEMQALPLPNHEISFQRNGTEIARYYFGPDLRRPFVFPIIGPSGRSLTRMGHPRDPESHSHHNSVWISHPDVNG